MHDRQRELERICQAALERPLAARARFVAEACGGDEGLRREAESLLARESAAASFLEAPALAVSARTMSTDTPALTAGRQIGPYTIVARLGSGGMGEVYLARDPTLRREVAIKVLPTLFTSDPDRLGRFEREARVLASLNHPNIATIHGVEHVDGIDALILEVVDGETLAERLQSVASSRHATNAGLPLSDALAIARQIAEALEAAHEKGIVHRDLKPANIKIRPDGVVKVLDFGLAKAIATDGSAAEGSQVPTRTMDGTRAGTILGTAAYMSPEQSRGEAVDKRTDVWAFGCLLYEMLAGRRAFAAASVTETLSEVLKSEPDWQRLHAETPDGVRRLLRRCLAKDRKRRLGDIHDAHLELDDVASSTSDHDRAASARPGRRERFAWASAVGLLVVIAGVLGVRTLRTDEIALRNAPVPAEVRFNVSYPRGVAADYAQLAISPDGQQIVVAPTFEGPERTPLWLRPLGSETGQLLAGTEGAGFPFWSPDGRSIGFFAELKLKRYDVTSQVIQVLADAPSARGGVWQDDGTILFAPSASEPLFRVPATGGTPAMATQLESGQNDHRGPFILPDREHFIYYARGAPQVRGVHVARLDGTDTKRLLDADGAAVYASSGHLLFPRNGELLAQAFDTTRLALDGEPFRVAEAIAVNPGLSLASLSASPSGPIAYGTESIRRTQFTWFDRTGRRLETLGPPDQRTLANPSLSSDGSRVAFSRIVGGNWDVWLIDLQGAVSKATSERVLDFNPVWAPNGRHIFYESNNGSIHMRSVTDGTPEQVLLQERTMVYPSDVSPDGSGLLYTRATGLSTDIYYLPLGADRTPRPFIQTPSQERDAQFFPNGKWVAYQGNETGHFEIYVQPYPGPGHRVQVSTGGGQHVRWARNGSELFYIAGDQRLTSVLVTFGANGTIVVGRPVGLFRTEFDNSFLTRQQYVVSPDGQRFLINAPTDAIEPPSIAMILNWKAIP